MIGTAFADTSYWVALLLHKDSLHRAARSIGEVVKEIVTTRFVVAEVGASFSRIQHRILFLALAEALKSDEAIRVDSVNDETCLQAMELFCNRPDKEWSLTDCISFVVMQRENLAEALTADHHFEQAGFIALLRT